METREITAWALVAILGVGHIFMLVAVMVLR